MVGQDPKVGHETILTGSWAFSWKHLVLYKFAGKSRKTIAKSVNKILLLSF